MPTTTTIVAVTLLAVSLLALFLGTNDVEDAVSIAFVGNSFTFVNDLPRVMEALGNLQRQDSCLHGATSITSLLQEGNGMYYHWGNSSVGDDTYFPDFGACTVRQLLLGYDEGLANGYYDADYYTDDGLNPCFQDAYYLKYSVAWRENLLAGESSSSSFHWDYVVINDHSMAPAVEENKNQSVATLWESYAPMLKATQSIPILFQTWAYWREDVNMTEFVDIPTFTLRLQEGYEEYAEILEEALPDHLKPEIAPVGLGELVSVLCHANSFVELMDIISIKVDRFFLNWIAFHFMLFCYSISCRLGGEFFRLGTALWRRLVPSESSRDISGRLCHLYHHSQKASTGIE